MRQPPSLPYPIQRSFLQFLEDHPPKVFSQSLRRLLQEYAENRKDGLPPNFERLKLSVADLCALLDHAATSIEEPYNKNC